MKTLRPFLKRLADLLDEKFFPAIIRYTTSRAHIVLLFLLWIALLVCGGFTAFELVGGNYTNGLSALASCIVLLQSLKQHKEHTKAQREMHQELKAHREESRTRHEETHQRLTVIHENVALPERKPRTKSGQ